MENYFSYFYSVNVNDKVEKKGGLSYVSWPYAWAEVKKVFPDATYTVYENPMVGLPYFTDGKTCMVKTGVTINGIEHIEFLPIMDYKNKSIPCDCVTSMDINKAIQRSLTKAVARHGLGLYIYAGEDLPEAEDEVVAKKMQVIDAKTAETLGTMLVKKGINVDKLLEQYKVGKTEELTAQQYGDILRRLNNEASR